MGNTEMTIKRIARMQPIGEATRYEAAAVMIAALAHRKQVNRWRMSKKSIRELCGSFRGGQYEHLVDALVEYGIQIMDADDKNFSFIYTEKTTSWYRMGLSGLTDQERRAPDVEKLEDEIGYTGCDLDEEEDGE
jgi:hypothetical protein